MKLNFSSATTRLLILILLVGSINCSIRSQENKPFSINESPLPAPTSPVMDYAGVLDANTKKSLEQKIIQFRDSTNPKVEFAVAIVQTTGERPIFDYSLAVARGWKIGSKDDDNPSALLFIAIGDRKYFTQVSKDLEDELPDGLVGQLQRQNLVPAFKQSNYGKGVSDTIDAYINAIRTKQSGGEIPIANTQNTENTKERKSGGSFSNIVTCLIILFILMIIIFSRSGSRRGGRNNNDRWRGGGFGGGASSALPWVIGSILANSDSSSSSSSSDWGSSSSGGDSWGGFGGGGDFGGGGAGGDW